ncbi:ATP-binding cassette domain-containing protein [Streptoalloteichus hindustanus]|uniref:ABC-2 type transport system ATP-binding protein n=1 Tax=Streptoalloteichus hindustanus TaxID=2017 RepID=A0A1M5I0E4_STRHI|nr:ATP-binding cassette domain-containing protein [Streptoalloteichus hindustanus]SHG21489.1 ABC-2 type transport system ATP-binding protein [Streptoalloteichus hindustanus]
MRTAAATLTGEIAAGERECAVLARGLRKRYGETTALDGFDLAVPYGTVCGLLGPNGAGKSTAVRVLSTLLRPDGGRAEVGGFDVVTQARQVRYRIGLTGQNPAVDDVLTGRGNLEMFGRLYHLGPRAARRRAQELLEQFNLTDVADTPPRRYSGGMRRRLDLAVSFIMAPPVLFLDEPTTGLDPRHRLEVWNGVRDLVAQGTTVLLTTHYLDEVDQLADDISVIDRGRVIARGTPDELKSTLGGDQLDVVLDDPAELGRAAEALAVLAGAPPRVRPEASRLTVPVRERVTALTEALRVLEAAGIAVRDIGIRRPTLDEVFVRLTGHHPESGETDTPADTAVDPAAGAGDEDEREGGR